MLPLLPMVLYRTIPPAVPMSRPRKSEMKSGSSIDLFQPSLLSFLVILLAVVICTPVFAVGANQEQDDHDKIVGGYFEEWSIYYAGYNVANLQRNGVASRLTHLTYAFGAVTSAGCGIADTWADYQSPFLPSVSGAPYTGPLYGNFAALQQLKHLHPKLKILISLGGGGPFSRFGLRHRCCHRSGAKSLCGFLYRSIHQGQCR
jgi:glycosyl hydrolase family 18 (putative chitinase)